MSRTSFRPSAALVVAVLALVVALGGTSYAAAKINGGQIAKGTIKGKALKNDTVTGAQIAESTLGQVPSAATAGTAAPSGPAGGDLAGTFPNPSIKANAVGATELGTVTERTSASVNVPANASNFATIQCQAGEQVISGGNDASSASSARLVASRKDGANGWLVYVFNDSASAINITVHAYCLAP